MSSENRIRVGVVGAAGRMGQQVCRALAADEQYEIVLAVDRYHNGETIRAFTGGQGPDIKIEDRLGAALDRVKTDTIIDFTHPSSAAQHALSALKRGVSPVIGTTGMSDSDLREIELSCRDHGISALYAPNFAIGAVLMMRFAQVAARYFPDVEVIEMHHDKKEDAPSGTAMLTAALVNEARAHPPKARDTGFLKVEGARGGRHQDVPVHSVRLPGLVAHQIVMFGGEGEMLTIRHDSLDRASFMEGVKLCLREVRNVKGFVIGMDKILFGA